MQTTGYSFFDIYVRHTVLDNGFTVFTMDTGTYMAFVEVSFRVGHLFDGKLPGISHFLEHMVFSGPEVDEWHPRLRPLVFLGAETGAATADFNTRYYAELPSEQCGLAVTSLLDVAFTPSFDNKRVDMERCTIMDEARTNSLSRELSIRMDKLLFPEFERRHISALGTPETISLIDRTALMAHHGKFYTPDQGVLIVVGKVDHEQIVRLAEAFLMPRPRGLQEALPNMKPCLYRASTEDSELSSSIQVYFNGPESCSDRIKLFYVMDLLCDVDVGSLFNRLRQKERLIYSLKRGVSEYPRIIKFSTSVVPSHFDDVEEALFEEIDRIVRDDFSDEAFELLVRRRLIGQKSAVESTTNESWAAEVHNRWLLDDYEDRRAEVLATTREQISQIAEKYLTRSNYGCLHIFRKK